MRKPTTNKVTRGPIGHGYPATDYSFQPDEHVYAPVDGVIVSSDVAGDCGNRIEYVSKTGQTKWYMCHFQIKKPTGVYKEGAKIGVMGNTGYSFGRHLHLVIYVKKLGVWVRVLNPNKWQNKRLKAIRETKADIKKLQAKLKKLEEC